MVNYDKWDKLDLGSDDDEPRTRGRPQVTRLEGPSTVTFGGGRGDVVDVRVDAPRPTNEPVRAAKASDKAPARNDLDASYAKFDALAGDISSDDDINDYYEDEYHAQMDAARRAEFEDTLRNPDGTWKELPPLVRQPGKYIGDMPRRRTAPDVEEARLMADMDRLAERTEAFTRNGAAENAIEPSEKDAAAESDDKGDPADSQQRAGYMWSQEHDECVLSVVVPAGTKAKDVVVECTEDRVKIVLANHASRSATMLRGRRHRAQDRPGTPGRQGAGASGGRVRRAARVWRVGGVRLGAAVAGRASGSSGDVSEEGAGRHDALVAQGAAQREGDRHGRAEVSKGGEGGGEPEDLGGGHRGVQGERQEQEANPHPLHRSVGGFWRRELTSRSVV